MRNFCQTEWHSRMSANMDRQLWGISADQIRPQICKRHKIFIFIPCHHFHLCVERKRRLQLHQK
ncbi:hypothetical protein Hanom_Chr15g01396461 [Helianthus anomalus]